MVSRTVFNCILFIWCVGVAFGEPGGYDYRPAKNEETEVEIQKVEVYEVPWIGDQQPQNSYGPPDQQYNPPPQAYGPPEQEYGTPSQEYGPPSQEYEPPQQTTTEYPDLTTTSSPDSVNATNTTSNNSTQNQTARLEEISGLTTRGQYYIYHPNGLLQKVIYLAEDDSKNMAYSTRLQYKNVDPIKGPIYTYDPNTYVFSRLNRK